MNRDKRNLLEKTGNILFYQTEDGHTKIQVKMEDETVWLTQDQMAELFEKSKSTINEHINNIYEEKELIEGLTMRKFGNSEFSTKPTHYYNLDVIISVGYRVKSLRGTQFRIWATQRLKEYIVKGFALDDERLKQGGQKARYFQELLQRIRDIRSSERNFYQKVTDIYATSIDYRKDAELTREFFATVQNKMHYAVHGHTAAEIIAKRANGTKPLMGLTGFKGNYITAHDVKIAKNYLTERDQAVESYSFHVPGLCRIAGDQRQANENGGLDIQAGRLLETERTETSGKRRKRERRTSRAKG